MIRAWDREWNCDERSDCHPALIGMQIVFDGELGLVILSKRLTAVRRQATKALKPIAVTAKAF
jgi:hypothetical protein